MHSQRQIIISSSKNLFEKIYQLAKAGNEDELKKIIKAGGSFKIRLGLNTPLTLLASEGDVHAVDMLIRLSPQKDSEEARPEAVEGYARAGFTELVNACLAMEMQNNPSAVAAIRGRALVGYAARGKVDLFHSPIDLGAADQIPYTEYRHFLIEGYAKGGHDALVEEELAHDFDPLPIKIKTALKGYAQSGDMARIQEILKRQQNIPHLPLEVFEHYLEYVLYFFAICGWTDAVNTLAAAYPYMSLQDALLEGYSYGNHLSQSETLLDIMVHTENAQLRENLAHAADKINPDVKHILVLNNANYFRNIMSTYSLDVDETKKLLVQQAGGLVWLLQGPQLVGSGMIPSELFLHISSMVLGMPAPRVEKVQAAVNERLLEDATATIQKKYNGAVSAFVRFFTHARDAQKEEKLAELQQNSAERSSYYAGS